MLPRCCQLAGKVQVLTWPQLVTGRRYSSLLLSGSESSGSPHFPLTTLWLEGHRCLVTASHTAFNDAVVRGIALLLWRGGECPDSSLGFLGYHSREEEEGCLITTRWAEKSRLSTWSPLTPWAGEGLVDTLWWWNSWISTQSSLIPSRLGPELPHYR